MFDTSAIWFINVERAFVRMHAHIDHRRNDESIASRQEFDHLTGNLLEYIDAFREPINLPVTKPIVESLLLALDSGTFTWREAAGQVVALQSCWEAELRSVEFWGTLAHADFYRNPTAGWEQVVDRFKCGDDVEEGRKCIALGRYTASVFHLMRVVEAGVLAFQVFLNGAPDPKPHFGSIVSKLEGLVQRTQFDHLTPTMQTKLPFLRAILPQLHAVKDAWRDKVTHVDSHIIPAGHFTEEKAIEIHNASLSLMKNLTENL